MADEFDENEDKPVDAGPPRARGEGVRIIGAEEAAAALESGTAAHRRPEDEPRPGDRPAPPDRSKVRGIERDVSDELSARSRPSPWGSRSEEPSGPPEEAQPPLSRFGRSAAPRAGAREDVSSTQPIVPPGSRRPAIEDPPEGPPSGGTPAMPHWTEPPTGEVPRILAGEDEETFQPAPERSSPRWRDQRSDWESSDFDDVSELAESEPPAGRQGFPASYEPDPYGAEAYEEPAEPAPAPIRTRRRPEPSPHGEAPPAYAQQPPGERNVVTAVVTGLLFGGVALLCFRAGPGPSLALAVAVVGFAAIELFAVLRRAGYRPATLLGITSAVSVMLAAYAKGESAIPLVLALTMVCALLWFMFGVVRARPTMNVGVTLLGVVWIGFLGSFAALLLRAPDRRGIAFLLGAAIATVAYDVGGMFIGSRSGRTPLAPEVSPSKTWEGVMGGAGAAIAASVLITRGIHPWNLGSALALGLVVAFMAPLGDLSQSLIKRDLGIKDMGTVLPGHGGVMDRFDALLFVLPATYYLVQLLQLA